MDLLVSNKKDYLLEVMIFSAKWCQPCIRYVPWVRKKINSVSNNILVRVINVEIEPEVCHLYRVTYFPSIIFSLRSISNVDEAFEIPGSRIIGLSEFDTINNIIHKWLS